MDRAESSMRELPEVRERFLVGGRVDARAPQQREYPASWTDGT
jgi:hypothetical protein